MYSHNQHLVLSITLFHRGAGHCHVTSCQLMCWLPVALLLLLGLLCLLRSFSCPGSASWRERYGGGQMSNKWKSPGGSDVTKWAYGREGTSAPGEAADAQQRLVQLIWPGGGSGKEILQFQIDSFTWYWGNCPHHVRLDITTRVPSQYKDHLSQIWWFSC